MLIIKYKDKTIEGLNPVDFELNKETLTFDMRKEKPPKRTLSMVESIVVDGVEIYRCPKEL